jgi:hypothetical protein
MADEPNNLVLPMLQDIRLTLDQHSKKLKEHSEAFRSIPRELHESRQLMTYTVDMASMEMQTRFDELGKPK